MELFIGYLVLINLLAFIFFGIDKRKAIRQKWRIKESVLLTFSIIGGGIGSFLGMKTFHHKTQKKKFIILVPVFTILFGVAIYFLNVYIKIF
ncbi:DUF1294 domain-containing protein [Mariniplasma anaerobium]|uniref:Membrane protein n=1 Tax=Mariniplasma anaerobium TaxID=2735436 RepID=A0A7U9XVS8_9MOLU|nr:DUF1294 domain-containing protein [Mariniplasma anaerobium]BCR36700.1 membrane protein [Mariniplasma anaerobium]